MKLREVLAELRARSAKHMRLEWQELPQFQGLTHEEENEVLKAVILSSTEKTEGFGNRLKWHLPIAGQPEVCVDYWCQYHQTSPARVYKILQEVPDGRLLNGRKDIDTQEWASRCRVNPNPLNSFTRHHGSPLIWVESVEVAKEWTYLYVGQNGCSHACACPWREFKGFVGMLVCTCPQEQNVDAWCASYWEKAAEPLADEVQAGALLGDEEVYVDDSLVSRCSMGLSRARPIRYIKKSSLSELHALYAEDCF